MTRPTYHVVPNDKGGWSVHKGDSRRTGRHFATKKAAEAYGRQVSFTQKTILVIYRNDGTPPSSSDQE